MTTDDAMVETVAKWRFTRGPLPPGKSWGETPFQAAYRHAVDAVMPLSGDPSRTVVEVVNAVFLAIDFAALVEIVSDLPARDARVAGEMREACAKVASKASLHGDMGEWDKGYNHACCNITARITALPTTGASA